MTLSTQRSLLFDNLPRRARIKRMHMVDIGDEMVEMRCSHCGYESGWIPHDNKSVSEIKKGFACPECNKGVKDASETV